MKKVALIMVVLWMGLIFFNSSRGSVASNNTSFKVLNQIKDSKNIVLDKDSKEAPKENQTKTQAKTKTKKEEKENLTIRKNAHAFEYTVLAILISNLLIVYGMEKFNAIIYIMFISLFYAVTDEFHQCFVPGRSPMVTDVLIDFAGSILGILIYYLVRFRLIPKVTRKKA